jgi:FMN phosphatase YigB (HAD superfamily)
VLFDVDGTLLLTHDEAYVEASRLRSARPPDGTISDLSELETALAAFEQAVNHSSHFRLGV